MLFSKMKICNGSKRQRVTAADKAVFLYGGTEKPPAPDRVWPLTASFLARLRGFREITEGQC